MKARKLVLYSDQDEGLTDTIDDRLFAMLPPSASVGYLPSGPDPERVWFRSREAFYVARGAQLEFFGLEEEFDPSAVDRLFACDAIHLSGGNTFRFLHWLRTRNLVEGLRRYVEEGGVLIGVSAGAILMTSDVSTSYLCGDREYPALDDYTGLGLVDFALLPHFDGSERMTEDLQRFSEGFRASVLSVPDGSGVVVEGDRTELLRPVSRYRAGRLET